MPYPEAFTELARKAATKFQSNVAAAVEWLDNQMRKRPELQAECDELFRTAAYRAAIYECRSDDNSSLMAMSTPSAVAQQKVFRGASADVATIRYLETFKIGGRVLGEIMGSELPGLAAKDRQIGQGFLARSRLCEALARIVAPEKRVGECVTNEQVHQIVIEAKGLAEAEAA
jgi:hypothetical protein